MMSWNDGYSSAASKRTHNVFKNKPIELKRKRDSVYSKGH